MESFEMNTEGYDLSSLRNEQSHQPSQRSNTSETNTPETNRASANATTPNTSSAPNPAPSATDNTGKRPAKEPKIDLSQHHNLATATRFFADGRMRMFFGILFFLFAAYLLKASFSFLSTGPDDQSIIQNNTIGQISTMHEGIENPTGWFGALMSYLLMNKWLGLGGFIIIFYIAAIGITLVKLHRFRFWQLTFKSLISAIAISDIAGLLTFNTATPTYWGGLHGYELNNMLIDASGVWGATSVAIALAVILVLIFINPIRNFYRWSKNIWLAQKHKMQNRYRTSMAVARAAMQTKASDDKAETSSSAHDHIEPLATEPTDTNQQAATENNTADTLAGSETTLYPLNLEEIPSNSSTSAGVETYNHTTGNMDQAASDQAAPYQLTEIDTANDANIPSSIETASDTEISQLSDQNTAEETSQSVNEISALTEIATETASATASDDNPKSPKVEVTNAPIEQADDEMIQPDFYDPTADLSYYRFPDIELLHQRDSSYTLSEEEQEENNRRIIDTLDVYGIKIEKIKATVGPTITLYEIVPMPGTRIATIKRLGDDMALSLSAIGIRIIAPMPGKGTIGMEVPNKTPQIVSMHSILSSRAYHESTAALPIALGTTIDNQVFITDLAKMPHLLVAGATGMGKSVGLNAIIASLLYKKHPAELKFVLIDPKMVEFTPYKFIAKHFLAKLPEEDDAIITDPTKVVATLNSLCLEMENRYTLLSEAGLRNIKEYNQRFISRRLNPEKGHRFLPYIVVIIDEFADLILTAGKDIETPISRIAAKARAVGIHMIIATQRPSVNVITGVIKANFPGRMAFRVMQMNDSRTILDRPGADQLIGKGDMLISRDGVIDRVQCAFIDTDEVDNLCKFISEQQSYPSAYELPEMPASTGDGSASGASLTDRDPMFADAGRAVIEAGMGSASLLQRKFNIGYPRAGKIIDQLAAAGVVGQSTAAGKPRPVLMDAYSFERYLE